MQRVVMATNFPSALQIVALHILGPQTGAHGTPAREETTWWEVTRDGDETSINFRPHQQHNTASPRTRGL